MNKRQVVQVLESAREKVARGWVRGVYRYKLMRTSTPVNGLDFDPRDPPAECFCVSGAILRSATEAARPLELDMVIAVAESTTREAIGDSIERWNDTKCTGRADAAAMLTKAIELASKEE